MNFLPHLLMQIAHPHLALHIVAPVAPEAPVVLPAVKVAWALVAQVKP